MPPVFRGIKVHLHADRLHVSEQELDTDMEHAKIHVWAAVAARACASMQRARYLWLAPSTDSDSCSHLFCLRRLKRHQGTDFSSICRKEFDYGKTPSLYPPFHPLPTRQHVKRNRKRRSRGTRSYIGLPKPDFLSRWRRLPASSTAEAPAATPPRILGRSTR